MDARVLRRGLLDNGYGELPIISDHFVAIESLPTIHKDPFDRMLIAQSQAEHTPIISNEAVFESYGVRRVW